MGSHFAPWLAHPQWLCRTMAFVDAYATKQTTWSEGSPVIAGSPGSIDPTVIEAMGCSPCDLWETARCVPAFWPSTTVRDARQRSAEERHHVAVVGQGWPFVQFWHVRWVDWQGRVQTDRWFRNSTANSRKTSSEAATFGLPWGVHWFGLGANIFLWSAAVWVLCIGWLALRTWSRRRRGVCVGCLYSVSEVMRCSECGRINRAHLYVPAAMTTRSTPRDVPD